MKTTSAIQWSVSSFNGGTLSSHLTTPPSPGMFQPHASYAISSLSSTRAQPTRFHLFKSNAVGNASAFFSQPDRPKPSVPGNERIGGNQPPDGSGNHGRKREERRRRIHRLEGQIRSYHRRELGRRFGEPVQHFYFAFKILDGLEDLTDFAEEIIEREKASDQKTISVPRIKYLLVELEEGSWECRLGDPRHVEHRLLVLPGERIVGAGYMRPDYIDFDRDKVLSIDGDSGIFPTQEQRIKSLEMHSRDGAYSVNPQMSYHFAEDAGLTRVRSLLRTIIPEEVKIEPERRR